MSGTTVCDNCGNEVVGEEVSEEWDSWMEFPDTCPHCQETLEVNVPDPAGYDRERFYTP